MPTTRHNREGRSKTTNCCNISSSSKRRKCGQQKTTENEGRTFSGRFCEKTLTGEGSIAYASGDRYDGPFADGLPEGFGMMTWVSGDVWNGEFKNGIINGEGIFTSRSETCQFEYHGGFANGNFNGRGTCRWANKSQYVGDFLNGVYEGLGTFTWEDSGVYKGSWKDGKRHGAGIYTSGDGLHIYDGDWQNDVKHGHGFQQLPDGRTFEGTFTEGLAGSGVLTLQDGLRVQADFLGAEDWDAGPVPPVWSAPPPAAAALGLADALRRQHLWTAAPAPAGVGGGEEHGAPALVELAPASDEFRAVAAYFCASADPARCGLRRRTHVPAGAAGAGAGRLRVESVRRVENGTLRALYLARRAHVARQCGACGAGFDAVRMERWVFHGPGNEAAHGDALRCIVEEGFRPLLAGSRVGAAYGQGTYFARDAHYSDGYARQEPDGARSMILAAAVLGISAEGCRGMAQPPLLPGQGAVHCHSLVDRQQDPAIFVVQDSAGAYPAYIIRYRRGPGAGPLEAGFPDPAGPDSLMARGDAAFRAQLQPAFDAAAAAFAAAATSSQSDLDGEGTESGRGEGAKGGGGSSTEPVPHYTPAASSTDAAAVAAALSARAAAAGHGAASPPPQSPGIPSSSAAGAVAVIDLTGEFD